MHRVQSHFSSSSWKWRITVRRYATLGNLFTPEDVNLRSIIRRTYNQIRTHSPRALRSWIEVNPHLPIGPVHTYQLDQSISNFRGVWCTFFVFILFRIDVPVSKQWRPWSDAAFCGVWSGSALFACLKLIWVNDLSIVQTGTQILVGVRNAVAFAIVPKTIIGVISFKSYRPLERAPQDNIYLAVERRRFKKNFDWRAVQNLSYKQTSSNMA